MTRTLALLCLLTSVCFGTTAFAQTPTPPVPPESWAGQLATLGRWLAEQQRPSCDEHCFVLQRLVLSGSARAGRLTFELEGSVLANVPVAVPLFGPVEQLQLSDVTENGQAAAIGFEENHYFLFTSARRFVLRGTIAVRNDRALTISGPLNSLETRFTEGALAEGNALSGLSNATVHLEDDDASPAPEPTVFRLSRAVRVGRELQFEYRLSLRSGSELGVVRLPLRHGERVLEVSAVQGWRVENNTLLLPTAGRTAEVTITGTLSQLGTFAPDERSSDEWWLLESDEEHRLQVDTASARMDPSRSPIARTQNSGRLYLVRRGQELRVSSQTLAAMEVLAAVLRSHQRTLVLTRNGDLVAEDTFQYENNGIEHLQVHPNARPIYLETDSVAERILRGEQRESVLVPLRVGGHRTRMQSMTHVGLSWWGGTLDLPMATTPLTTSRADLTLGLPSHVHPVLVTGCERTWFSFGTRELAGVLFAMLAAWVLLRENARRLFGAVFLSGLWLLSSVAFSLLVPVAAGIRVAWGLRGVFRGAWGVAIPVACVCFGFAATLPSLLVSEVMSSGSASNGLITTDAHDERLAETRSFVQRQMERGRQDSQNARDNNLSNPAQNFMNQLGNAYQSNDGDGNRSGVWNNESTAQGTTPVALPLPRWQRTVRLSRELVTTNRPFHPKLYYVTGLFLLPFYLLWFASAIMLAWLLKPEFAEAAFVLRERIDALRVDREEDSEEPAAEPKTTTENESV